MADEAKLKLTGDGTFISWFRLLEMHAMIIGNPLNSVPQNATAGKIAGVDFGTLLRPYIGKKIKVLIDIQNET